MSGRDDIAGGSGRITAATVNIRIGNSPTPSSVPVKLNSTVKHFRTVVNRICSVLPQHQLLICNGRVMTDQRTLNSYGLEPNGTVDLLVYRDALLVNAYFAEDSVGDLGNLDVSEIENLARNPEILRILNDENTRMRAICDRNLNLLRQINDLRRPPPPPPNLESSSSRQLAAGGRSLLTHSTHSSAFRMYSPQAASKPPLPSTMIRSDPRVNSQLQSMHPSNSQNRDMPQTSHVIHQVSPEMEQMESEQNVGLSLTLGIPQNDGGAAPQNDGGGTSAGGEAGERFFNHVQETYAVQLSQLWQMGFTNIRENTITLFGTAGDVVAAADKLGRNPTQ